MSRLHIHDRRERAFVATADRMLGLSAALTRPFRRRRAPSSPQRILLLRLERIGDLLMALPAIADVRAAAPSAEIHLVVGSWNAEIARAIEPVTAVQTLDASWLAREGHGLGMPALLRAARRWKSDHYDVAINFEPDIRTNLLLAASGAPWTAGYRSGGGGPLLDLALDYDTRSHTTDNARRLVGALFDHPARTDLPPALVVPSEAHHNAERLLASAGRPLIAMHVSGGRPIKQWDAARFAETARRLISSLDATIVLTGSPDDRAIVDAVKQRLPPGRAIDVSGDVDLLTLAGILDRVDLLITGDTGPMHLAAAVNTPIVAIFGPSDPARYGPRGPSDRIVRVDLPCAPCNRIRLPPERCVGHIPDCLALVTADSVFAAARSVLDRATPASSPARAHNPTA